MLRHLLIAAALAALPTAAEAQFLPGRPPPPTGGGFGGGFPTRPLLPTISPMMPNISPMMPNLSPVTGGGFGTRPSLRPGHGWWGGHGGWFPWYGYAAPVYPFPVPFEVPVPVFVPTQPPEPPLPISGESVATLVLQFPTSAEVWVNGKKSDETANETWTLTSPPVRTGAEYTFVVKARWILNGKTYEYERSFAVAGGNRSKAIVVSGTEIKE